jgi:hypothetical protein
MGVGRREREGSFPEVINCNHKKAKEPKPK